MPIEPEIMAVRYLCIRSTSRFKQQVAQRRVKGSATDPFLLRTWEPPPALATRIVLICRSLAHLRVDRIVLGVDYSVNDYEILRASLCSRMRFTGGGRRWKKGRCRVCGMAHSSWD